MNNTTQPSAATVLDRAAARALDRAATEEFGIPSIILMENAAIAVAREAFDMRHGGEDGVLIVCGRGNNGGDGWAVTRHLANAGTPVTVAAVGDPRDGTDAAVNRAICDRMGIPVVSLGAIATTDQCVVVDAVFGTGLDRPVSGPAADAIEAINASGRSVLAVDVPSGLDADLGEPLGVAVVATRTVTFVGLKPGLLTPAGRAHAGEVVIASIGAPATLTERFGTPLSAVATAPFLRPPA